MAPKLSSLPCFEAFWVIVCPEFYSYVCLVCGGPGVTRAFLMNCQKEVQTELPRMCCPTLRRIRGSGPFRSENGPFKEGKRRFR